jgi:hypothetical protein
MYEYENAVHVVLQRLNGSLVVALGLRWRCHQSPLLCGFLQVLCQCHGLRTTIGGVEDIPLFIHIFIILCQGHWCHTHQD